MFDGSSIAGWKAINESDMMLMPDPATAVHRSVLRRRRRSSIVCDVLEPTTGQPYNRDPRSHRQEGRGHASSRLGIGDTVYLRPRGRVLHLRRRALSSADPTTPASSSTRSNCRPTPTPTTRAATSATASAPRAATSRCRRSTRAQDMRAEMLAAMARDGRRGREAPPRSGVGPARARHEVRAADADGRPAADLQVRASTRSPRPTARPRPSCRSRSTATTARACTATSRSGRTASRCSPATSTPTCRRLPLLHRRHHQARQGDQRLHQPDDQLLQAAGPGLRGAGAARLLGAQPLGLVPHPVHDQPEGQARRSPLPRSARQPLSRLRRDADGRPRRHQEQDRSRRPRWTRTSTTCRRRS